MSLRLSVTSWRSIRATLSRLLGDFARWWLDEFLALFPPVVAKWLVGKDGVSLVTWTKEESVTLALVDNEGQVLVSTRIPVEAYSPSSIEDFLASHGKAKGLAVGIRLPRDCVFTRKLLLPDEATRSLDAVLAQDLTRRTPFRLDSIHHDHASRRATEPGKIVVWQWLVQCAFVAEALVPLRLTPERVAFIEAESTGDEPRPRIALSRNDRGRRSWGRRAAVALSTSAAMLAVLAMGLEFWRQQTLLDDLDRQLATARSHAAEVRAAMNGLEQKQLVLLRLRSQKADRPGLLGTWNEATRLLPSHSWLIELRLTEIPQSDDQQVTMTGFSSAASSLVGIVDQSPLFAEASLTAPIALDPIEQRERFVLQAKLRDRQQIKQAAK